jgi:hypothetical protein
MPQHMGMDMKSQSSALAGTAHQIVDRKAGKLIAAFSQKQPGEGDIATLRQLALEHTEFIRA